MLNHSILKGFTSFPDKFRLFLLTVFPHVFPESNHALLFFIPEFVEHTTQAFDKGDFVGHAIQDRIFVVATGQLVIRYQGIQVVNMVVTDVAGKPMEHAGKVVKSTALHGGANVIPLVFPFFVGCFVLMLHIKKPDCNDGKKQQDRQMHHQKCLVSQQ